MMVCGRSEAPTVGAMLTVADEVPSQMNSLQKD